MADPDPSERAPETAEVHRRWGEFFMRRLNKVMPAVVTAYDADKNKVSIKPLIQRPYRDENGDQQYESQAVISGVPVEFPGAGGFVVAFPISDGNLVIDGQTIPATIGTAFFADRSMDNWLSGQGQEVAPTFDHNHHDADAIFMPGLNPFGAPLPGLPTDHMAAGVAGGLMVHFRRQTITVGDEAGSDFLALAAKVLTELQKISGLFDSVIGHTHSFAGGAVGPPTGGSGTPSGTSLYSPSSVAASQAKGK